MPQLQDNVKRMQAAGVPEDEIAAYIEQFKAPALPPGSPPGPAISTITGQPVDAPALAPSAVSPVLGDPTPRTPPSTIGGEVSTITGQPTAVTEAEKLTQMQGIKDAAVAGVRYGIPVSAGIANPSLSIPVLIGQSLIAGGSEVAARRLERTAADPELDTLWSELQAGGATAALDFGVNVGMRGLGSAVRAIGRKLFIPSEIPLEVRIAQETLGEFPAEPMKQPGAVKRFLNWTGANKGKRPFSLTYGQINAEEKRFIGWLEGVTRAGIGSRGVMSQFDIRNERVVADKIQEYVEARATQTTGPEFSTFAKRIIGDINKRGEVFTPVTAYRKYLYTQFESALSEAGGTVDASALRRYIHESAAVSDNLPNRIYARLRSEGLAPPLTTPSKSTRSIKTTKTQKISQEDIDSMSDLTRTDLLTGKSKRTAETIEGQRAANKQGTAQTITESKTVQGMTEEELAAEWANIPAADANKVIKVINSFWKDGADESNNVLSFMRNKVEEPFQAFIKKDPALKQLHDAADTFFKAEVGALRNAHIKGLRKVLSNNPSKALSLLGGGNRPADARGVFDRLMTLKHALGFSAQTPRVGKALTEAMSAHGIPATEAMAKMYERTFLRPIRYDMISRHQIGGKLNPQGFLNMLEKNSDVPELFDEVFGSPAALEEIKRLMTTLAVLKQPTKEKNIFIQLAQASQLVGFAGGVTGAFFSDDPEIKAGSIATGTAILLGPYMLSRALTNSSTIRAFTDGITEGIRSSKFAMALRKLAEMKVASELFRESPTQDALDYYSTMPASGQR